MTTARTIITLGLESMNRLSPGETIDADLAAMAMRQLNAVADSASANRDALFKQAFMSGTVSGTSFSIATGSFASVGFGDTIEGMTADRFPMRPITMQQYLDIYTKAATGRPNVYAFDGAITVYIYPAAVNSVITMQSRVDLSQFADLDTDYVMPNGYLRFFSAALAVALAPALLGTMPPALKTEARIAAANIEGSNIKPRIIGGNPISLSSYGSSNSMIFAGPGSPTPPVVTPPVSPPTVSASVYADNYADNYA